MAKPRIIIADTDNDYIIPLQLKFVEEYFEKVDIEIITDQGYFDALFNTPQKADILIVAEGLYDGTLQRHNIRNIFLMTEQPEDEQTGDLNVNRIFKYTSIKEIINEITGRSADVLNKSASAKKETQIVLAYSASGGAGKTTVALGVCSALTRNYKRVLYISAEHLQSFHSMVENRTAIASTDAYMKLTSPSEESYTDIKHVIRQESFSYVPPFKAAIMSLGIPYSVYENIARGAKKSGDYDFIVIDADSTFDDEQAGLLEMADKVILVTKQTLNSVLTTNTLVSNINGATGEKYIYICNDFKKDRDNALISPGVSLKFTVADYIDHFDHYDQRKIADIAKENSIQRVALLII